MSFRDSCQTMNPLDLMLELIAVKSFFENKILTRAIKIFLQSMERKRSSLF